MKENTEPVNAPVKYRFVQGDRVIFLASGSPRRRELCTAMGLSFAVLKTDADESLPAGTPPAEGVRLLAERKARAGLSLAPAGALLVAADTTVELDGKSYGKPCDEAEALCMLMALSGRRHFVHTGVCVAAGGRLYIAVETTAVTFRPYGEEEARAYVRTGEPMDKAGAYGIQGQGGSLVAGIEGELDNVIGLPTRALDRLLSEAIRQEVSP